MTHAAPPELQADCSRCAALCCVAFAAEESPNFSVTKDAGEPCPNLGTGGSCNIYADRVDMGFSGCLKFDCFGAGQRVMQDMFGGRSWQDEPELLQPMLKAFATSRKACELLYLVYYARKEAPAPTVSARLDGMEARLEAITTCSDPQSISAELGQIEHKLRGLFAAIKTAAN